MQGIIIENTVDIDFLLASLRKRLTEALRNDQVCECKYEPYEVYVKRGVQTVGGLTFTLKMYPK